MSMLQLAKSLPPAHNGSDPSEVHWRGGQALRMLFLLQDVKHSLSRFSAHLRHPSCGFKQPTKAVLWSTCLVMEAALEKLQLYLECIPRGARSRDCRLPRSTPE